MMEMHYFFPPASGYRPNKCLFLLKSDPEFLKRYLENPERALTEAGLGAETQAALRSLDRDGLVAMGAHPYLVFMAGLRLRMEREPENFEHF